MLSSMPHPELFEVLYAPGLQADLRAVLPHLLQIDAAHVLMLAERGLMDTEAAARILGAQAEMAAEIAAGRLPALGGGDGHRGLFWLYEQHFIRRLGGQVGGAAHLARSRNDINATVARMRARQVLIEWVDSMAELLAAVAGLAGRQAGTLMSGFTHMQPAQPTTFGHYLAGVGAELGRGAEWLAAAFAAIDRSPMGAAAGAGTSIDIDRHLVARYLGFSAVADNAADAVASRDFLVQMLAPAAAIGVTLTRLAQDLQTWSSQTHGWLRWPDELVSTSSIMPQKRNAFVLENVRGMAVRPTAALVDVLMAMKSVPFANSVEVSSEAVHPAWPALAAARDAARLMTLLLAHVSVDAARMRAFLAASQTTMTALADHLVTAHGLAFRTAHDAVASVARALPQAGPADAAAIAERLAAELAAAAPARPAAPLDRQAVAAALDPAHAVAAARHGGGPAPEEVAAQVAALDAVRQRLAAQAAGWRRQLAAADALRAAAAAALRDRVPAP